MNEKISYTLIAVLAGLLLFFVFGSCHPDPTTHKVIIPVEEKITDNDKKIMPDVERKVVYKPAQPEIGKRVETSILNSTTRTVLVETQKIDWGWSNKVLLVADGHFEGPGIGIGYRGPFWYRAGLNAILTTSGGSLGADWQLLRNTHVGLAYGYNLHTFMPSPSIWIGLGF